MVEKTFNYSEEVYFFGKTVDNSIHGVAELAKFLIEEYNKKVYIVYSKRYFEDVLKKYEENYHKELKNVVWTDDPDVSNVPDFDKCGNYGFNWRYNFPECLKADLKEKTNKCCSIYDRIRKHPAKYYFSMDTKQYEGRIYNIHKYCSLWNENDFDEVKIYVELFDKTDKESKKLLKDICEAEVLETERIRQELAAKAKAEADAKAKVEAFRKSLSDEIKTANPNYKDNTISLLVHQIERGEITKEAALVDDPITLLPEIERIGKDIQRIHDIMLKSRYSTSDSSLLGNMDYCKAEKLAKNMNDKITGELKRMNRAKACIRLGFPGLAKCFTSEKTIFPLE